MVHMELYRSVADQSVKFQVPSASLNYTLTITSPEHPEPSPLIGPGVAEGTYLDITIPYKHTSMDGKVEITASFDIEGEGATLIRSFDVVTPVFTYDEFTLQELEGIGKPSQDDIEDLERFIRHIIEAYTGQSFGYSAKTYAVTNPHRGITFDAPMLEFTGISSRYLTGSVIVPGSIPYEVFDDGFGMRVDLKYYYYPKTDTFFPAGQPRLDHYEVSGNFGYREVPQDVKEAARILIGLFNCDQTLWRDRYIENLRNADGSTIKYNEGAYIGTGSVAADQLLAKYVRTEYGAAVI